MIRRILCWLRGGHKIEEAKVFMAIKPKHPGDYPYILPIWTRWDRCTRCSYKIRLFPPQAGLFGKW